MRFYALPTEMLRLDVTLKALRPVLLIIALTWHPWGITSARSESLAACTARAVDDIAYTTGGRVEITADSAQADMRNEWLTFAGSVEMSQDARRITADQIRYNQRDDTVDASGAVTLTQPGLVLSGDQAHLDLRKDYARLQPLRYELPEIGGRGRGAEGESLGDNRFRAQRIDFTTCAPGDDSWFISARELEVDRNSGIAKARNAKLVFKGMPLLASPWLQFPIDDRRVSGFLIPGAGYSSRNGLEVTLPYYLNLAPSYDATLYPRLIEKRGLLIGGEFRYLMPGHVGRIYAEALPNDKLYEGDNDLRGAVHVKHNSVFSERLRGLLLVNAVSDEAYLEDLGRGLGVSSTVYLTSAARLTYFGDTWQALANWQAQDVLDDSDEPLSRAPQLLFTTAHPLRQNVKLHLDAEFVNFERSGAPSGPRIDLHPALSAEWREPWGYVRPRFSARYTGYELDGVQAGSPTSPDRSLYTISLDTGLFFERDAQWLAGKGIQTLEPRMFYLYTRYRDQSDIPVFDSDRPELSFPDLFVENRFTGADRVGDANQLTLALSTRFLEEQSHRERFSASVGQILYFADRRVQLPGDPVETADISPLVGELDLTISDEWSTTAIVQWDVEESSAENTLLRLRYKDRDARQFLNLGYRYDPEGDQEYTDISFAVPFADRYRAVGRWQYSQSDNRTMEALGGLEYDTCCWRFRTAVRHYLTDSETNYDTAFFLQLELKGLTRLGDDIDQILNRSVYGYGLLDE